MSQNTSQRLTATRVAGHIGAGIDGIELSQPIAPRTVADIREAALTHKVVFFHDQKIGHAEPVDAVNPPMVSILRAETAPAYGGDTQWTNLIAAYELLSTPLQRLIDNLRAVYTFWAGYQMSEHDEVDRSIMERVNAKTIDGAHSVMRLHPETDERALFVLPSRTSHILHRVTLVGNIPVGPGGFTSHAVVGHPLGSADR
ncbi:TauD/TfdA dioxygenase family protein [Nocardia sp. NPDC058705]|uniref:TauD/TfdA dioxygenase family protein n=1 Tax=Nocardia sp. NPDC058705 TaxID=3346609 RepID=UPI0036B0B0D9